jgi:hypothetical protein
MKLLVSHNLTTKKRFVIEFHSIKGFDVVVLHYKHARKVDQGQF